jgi:hypothetical protein
MFNQNNLKRPAASFAAVIGLSLVLSACGGGEIVTPDPGPKPDPTPTEQAGLIKGQITPFKAGDSSRVSAGAENETDKAIATAPVDGSGKFDLGLPKAGVMTASFSDKLVKPENVFGCTKAETEVVNAPAGMLLLPVADLKTDKFQTLIAEADPGNPVYNYKAWWFSSVQGTFRFKGTCTQSLRSPIDTTLELKKGWNVVNTFIDFGKSEKYTVTTQPTTYIPWKLAAAAASGLSLNAQSVVLSPNFFTPWKNLPEYQNR